MNALIRFLLRFKTLFLFILLELLSLVMIVDHNQFQRVHFLSSSSVVVGTLHGWTDGVSDYFSLGSVNKSLAEENAQLKSELSQLRNQVQFFLSDTSYAGRKYRSVEKKYTFVTAKVVQGSCHLKHNYLIIDKGTNDGLQVGMGVVCEKGVVGILCEVSSHFSTVMPILNPQSNIFAKVPEKSEVGTIVWHGGDKRYAKMEEVPLYIPIAKGDTILTSTYSSVFPEGIGIGTISDMDSLNNNFYSIDVRLSVDFSDLNYVDVIQFKNSEELKKLDRKEGEE